MPYIFVKASFEAQNPDLYQQATDEYPRLKEHYTERPWLNPSFKQYTVNFASKDILQIFQDVSSTTYDLFVSPGFDNCGSVIWELEDANLTLDIYMDDELYKSIDQKGVVVKEMYKHCSGDKPLHSMKINYHVASNASLLTYRKLNTIPVTKTFKIDVYDMEVMLSLPTVGKK